MWVQWRWNDRGPPSLLLSNKFKGHGQHESPNHRLGELLVSAGILRADKLPEALQLSKTTGSPIGRVLVMLSCVDQADVDAALQIQRMIRDSQISPDFGIQALHESSDSKTPIMEVLTTFGHSKEYVIRNALGELLVEAGMMTRQALTEAIRISTLSGMPLGKYLSVTGNISTPVLFEALNAQVEIRDRRISRDQAVQKVKETSIRRTAISQNVAGSSTTTTGSQVQKEEIKLGELLCLAEVISETDVLSAIEVGLFRQQPIGQVLVDSNMIPNFLIQPAIELQNMVKRKDLRPTQAAQALMFVHKEHVSVQDALRQLGLGTKKLDGWKEALELLGTSGLIGQTAVKTLIDMAEKRKGEEVKTLLDSGLVDELLFQSAVRCNSLLQAKKLRKDQAIIALHYCLRSRTGLDDALSDLSYSV
jgi:hypothetical protein